MSKEHISIKSEMDKLPQRLSPEGFDSWLETAGKNEMQIEFNKLSEEYRVLNYYEDNRSEDRDDLLLRLDTSARNKENMRRMIAIKAKDEGSLK